MKQGRAVRQPNAAVVVSQDDDGLLLQPAPLQRLDPLTRGSLFHEIQAEFFPIVKAMERGGEGRLAALFGLVGAINLPIIHYSVLWWRTLHQGQSISIAGGSSIAPELLWPLPLTMIGFTALFAAVSLMFAGNVLAAVGQRPAEGAAVLIAYTVHTQQAVKADASQGSWWPKGLRQAGTLVGLARFELATP